MRIRISLGQFKFPDFPLFARFWHFCSIFLAKTEYFYGADKKRVDCLSKDVKLNIAVMETTLLTAQRPEVGARRQETWDVVYNAHKKGLAWSLWYILVQSKLLLSKILRWDLGVDGTERKRIHVQNKNASKQHAKSSLFLTK